MQMTAVVVNAGLGDISTGLELAGFKVIAASEADQNAAAVHRANLDALVLPFPFMGGVFNAASEADLLAGRLWCPAPSHGRHAAQEDLSDPKTSVSDFLALLQYRRPRAFLLTFSISFMKSAQLRILTDEAAQKEYRCWYRVMDVTQAVGVPVMERMACMVGVRSDVTTEYEWTYSSQTLLPPKTFLQLDEQVDPWYFKVKDKPEHVSPRRDKGRFYCWKSHAYVGTDLLWWNTRKIPLIDTGEDLRKVTHREIANLKGFPDSYALPDHTNRSWLYRMLESAANVQVVKQIADGVFRTLTEPPLLERQPVPRPLQFENLFGRYLAGLEKQPDIRRTPSAGDRRYDFELQVKDQPLRFDLKCYSGRCVPAYKVRTACTQVSFLPSDDNMVLVIANEVPEYIKTECWEKFKVAVWDVHNLLWLFQNIEDIQNEFIALLDYSVRDIEPLPPDPDLLQKAMSSALKTPGPEASPKDAPPMPTETAAEAPAKPLSWAKRLRRIKPGMEQFREYEQFCIDILKYTLGDYLALWESQKQTDDGLHRFDLCCKIKSGVHHSFFNSVEHHFHSRYIVFEFKNYADRITQKEIYATDKYLYETALRKVAVIISRQGYDTHALQAAQGSLREDGKLILCLSDQDLLHMAGSKARNEEDPADFLDKMLDALLIHLEK